MMMMTVIMMMLLMKMVTMLAVTKTMVIWVPGARGAPPAQRARGARAALRG